MGRNIRKAALIRNKLVKALFCVLQVRGVYDSCQYWVCLTAAMALFVSIPACLTIARFFLGSVFLCEAALAQQATSVTPVGTAGTVESNQQREISSSAVLDIYVQVKDNARGEIVAAVTLFSTAGQISRQGIIRAGHVRWPEVAPGKYEVHVIAPGYERVIQQIDASSLGQIRVDVQLRPQTGGDKTYPPASSDPDVNYVFGLFASRLGDWEQAKSYWTKVLEVLPDHVPSMVSMSEALLSENKALGAMEYLVRAEKIDPTYWRTQAVLAEIALRAGSADEAISHAERAMTLGHDEAASVAPLLARALVARASEVLRTYLGNYPEDAAAKKQLEGLDTPFDLRASGQPSADFKERSAAGTTGKPSARSSDSRWLPPEVDENIPPVKSGVSCNLDEVLEKAGKRIQEFVGNVDRFTATESLVHEAMAKSGNVVTTEKRKFDYVVSIAETRPGFLDLQEYESNGSAPGDLPGGITTRGLPALVLIFHPYYSGTFAMKCEGLAELNGKRTWQVYFRQREDKPNKIRSYRIGSDSYPVALKGRAWIVADSYEILGLQTDLVGALPEIRLTAEHTAIQYGPVRFSSRDLDMWLPQTAEVYIE
jgi:tetratricopeptide (TPR) repeat protein